MEMGSKSEIASIKPEGEIYRCPACGYTDGWHVSFKVGVSGRDAEIILICPNCHNRFQIGWQVSFAQN